MMVGATEARGEGAAELLPPDVRLDGGLLWISSAVGWRNSERSDEDGPPLEGDRCEW